MTYFDTNEVQSQSVLRWDLVNGLAMSRNFTYDYDSRHQLVAASDSLDEYDSSFSYTNAGRFVDAFVKDLPGAPLVTGRDVSYDYGDNVLVDAHAVEALTKPDGSTHTAYTYDLSGNVTNREEGKKQKWNFSYDGDDQQRRVIGPGGNEELYYYDENNQRFLSVERNKAGDTIRTRFWFGNTELWYGNGDGIKEKAMTNLSLGATAVARIDNELGQQELEYSFHNGLGHMMAAVSEAGALTTSYIYGPFGEIIEQSGETDDHLRRFNGKEADQLSRLNYYGYRYYDPLSLQWTQADPLYRVAPDIAFDEPRRMALYTFTGNNPIRYVDPDGKNIRFAKGATWKQKKKFLAATQKLTRNRLRIKNGRIVESKRKGTGQAKGTTLISRLIADKEHYTVLQAAPSGSKQASAERHIDVETGKPAGTVINIDLDSTKKANVQGDGTKQPTETIPPSIALGHEYTHADEHARGTAGSEEQTVGTVPRKHPDNVTENELREEQGEPPRTRYICAPESRCK